MQYIDLNPTVIIQTAKRDPNPPCLETFAFSPSVGLPSSVGHPPSIYMKSSNGKRPLDSSRHSSAPATKKSKLSDESSPLPPLSQSGFAALVHPMTFSDFITRFWEPSRLVHFNRPYNPRWNEALAPSVASKLAIESTLSSSPLPAYYLTDVQLIGYSDTDDDLIFETPNGGAVDMAQVWSLLHPSSSSSGARPAFHLSNVDLFSKDIAKLLEEMEPQWKGDGAIASTLSVASAGTIPFAVHADGQAQFIVQIRGKQIVTVLESPDGPEGFIESAGEDSFPCFVHGPYPEVIIPVEHARNFASHATTIELSPGSTLFLPPCVKVSDIPLDYGEDSIFLTIYLSPQPSFKASLDTLLALAVNSTPEITQTSTFTSNAGNVPTFSTEDSLEMVEVNRDDGDNGDGSDGNGVGSEEEGEESSEQDDEGDDEEQWALFPHNLPRSKTNDNGDGNSGKKSGEEATGDGSRMKRVFSEVLQRAAHLAPKFVDSLMVNTSFTRSRFVKAIPEMQKKIDVSNRGLEAMLNSSGGLLKISNFFPNDLAESIHQLISHIPDAEWQVAYAEENASQNNIDHAFHSARTFASHHALFALFKRFMPELFGDFSVGKYTESHFIAPHDDRAYKEVNGEHFSRHIAVIYYCSKDWKKEYGGQLVDMVTGKEYVPEFNSIVAFSVPRFHEVKPVLLPSVERYSVFGWFFKPGINYELWDGKSGEDVEQ